MRALLTVCLLFGFIALAGAEESKVFTDTDLEHYRKNSDSKSDAVTPKQKTDISPSQDRDTNAEAKEWCSRGRAAADRINVATENVRKAEAAEISSRNVLYNIAAGGISPSTAAAKAATEAKEELDEAIKEKQRLEDAAHSKGVPPGWLNCNY